MDRDTDRIRSFSRRAFLVGGIQAGLMTILTGRLAWLQIAEGQRYQTLAEKNRINMKLIPPTRGLILDRNGVPLAANSQNFRVVVVPEQTDDLKKALSRIQKLIPITEKDIQRILKQAEKSPPFAPLEVKENLDWDSVARIEVNTPDLPGVSISVGDVRSYPLGPATSHIIGYVGAVSQADQGKDPLLSMPGFQIGKTGIERTYDLPLRGRAGTAEVEVNVVGREVRELKRHPGVDGQAVTLTIDAALQKFVQDRLSQQPSAAAVIMDAHNGAVYALASYPGFDPNEFARGLSADLWEKWLADPALPLNNKAAGGQYPPGSTFKMVTALAALEAGLINVSTTAFCPGHHDLGSSRFHCWKTGGHGNLNVIEALSQSCDTFFYKIAVDLGINRIAEMAGRLGLGKKLGIELPEERSGLMPTTSWKKENMKEPWQPGESVVASIGQGYTLTTPLQLATMTSRLVNGGIAVEPRLTGIVGGHGVATTAWPATGIKKAHLDIVMKGMARVVNHEKGTAYWHRITEEGMEMGGKTGTSQVRRITREERAVGRVRQEDLPWRYRHHALFVGYAPLAKPRYVCSVIVEHGISGSAAAAPIAHDILLETQKRNPAAQEIRT